MTGAVLNRLQQCFISWPSLFHILARKIGLDICKVLPAIHTLTGSDTTSKVGSKAAALKVNPVGYLENFGKELNDTGDSLVEAEKYLVQVFKSGAPYATMDELRYYIYHHGKNISFAELPPTSIKVFFL